jgi:hypothetical protein
MARKTIMDKITDLQADPLFIDLNQAASIARKLVLKLTEYREWDEFIEYFVDKDENGIPFPDQLARLTLKDTRGTDQAVKDAVSYLFCNSVCGGSTGSHLHERVGDILDQP